MSPTQAQLRNLRLAGFSLALALLFGVGGAALWNLRRAAAGNEWVEHTHRVIAHLQDYRAALRTIESANRGFRLTGMPALHDEFVTTVPKIRQKLAELRMLVADNPAQHKRAVQLQAMTRVRLETAQAVLDGPGDIRTLLQGGARGTARIEALATAMLLTEERLLQLRRAEADALERRLAVFTAAGIIIAVLLLALLMRGLQREILHSRQLETQARSAAIGLEDSLTQLAAISEQRAALGRYVSLLQSCADATEALRLTGHVIAELLPRSGGRCYLLHASQDLAETAIAFGTPAVPSLELLQPTQCWSLRRGQAYRVDELRGGVACDHVDAADAAPGSWSLCVPLIAQGAPLGMLHVSSVRAADRNQAQGVVENIAEQLALTLINLQLRDTLRMQSLRDPLTGLFNRRYLDESLQREVTRCLRRGQPLAVMMLDIDHFKAFNDANGHAAGDALLTAIGHTLQSMTRSEDLACRYGGEEFTVVLVEASAVDALRRADDIRLAIGSTTAQHLRQTLGPCTASIGLAMLPQDGQSPMVLLQQADAALYRAKAAGRNRVECASTVH